MLIVGGSTRAAAWSAVRGGFAPIGCDLFADDDLRQVADVVPVTHYPESLAEDLKHCSTEAWMFTGAMENYRAALQSLMQADHLGLYCGPSFDAIEQLRNPVWLAGQLAGRACYPPVALAGFRSPDSLADSIDQSEWLRKPLASGGGRGIQRVPAGELAGSIPAGCYCQRHVAGLAMSAVFAVDEFDCRCLLVSEQIVGCNEVAAPSEFTYCGSMGPVPISAEQSSQLASIAQTLVGGLSYRGLLGLDVIWDGRKFWLIEVNPRCTASCELWDLSTGGSAVAEHLRACGLAQVNDGGPRRLESPSAEGRLFGKLILYADRELIAPDLSCCLAPRPAWSLPGIADVPAPNSLIPAQFPCCTVFASASSRDECCRKLLRRAKRVRRWFAEHSSPPRRTKADLQSSSSGP